MRTKDGVETWKRELKAENEALKAEVKHLREILAQEARISRLEEELDVSDAELEAEREAHKKTKAERAEIDRDLTIAKQRLEEGADKQERLRERVAELQTEVEKLELEKSTTAGNPSLDEALNSGDGSYKP